MNYKRLGDGLTIAIPAATLALAAFYSKEDVFKFGLAYCLTALITFLFKGFTYAPRPNMKTTDSIRWKLSFNDGDSFPSGHTSSAMAGATYAVFLYWPVGLALLVFAFLCAFSRVKVLAHFWRDVFFGSIVAQIGCGIVYWNLFNITRFIGG